MVIATVSSTEMAFSITPAILIVTRIPPRIPAYSLGGGAVERQPMAPPPSREGRGPVMPCRAGRDYSAAPGLYLSITHSVCVIYTGSTNVHRRPSSWYSGSTRASSAIIRDAVDGATPTIRAIWLLVSISPSRHNHTATKAPRLQAVRASFCASSTASPVGSVSVVCEPL